MRLPEPLPRPHNIAAIAGLLVRRARAGEFGYTDFKFPLPIFQFGFSWRIGDAPRVGGAEYLLSHIQAAVVALGVFPIDKVPPTAHIRKTGFRWPTMDDLIERKPAGSETTAEKKAASK